MKKTFIWLSIFILLFTSCTSTELTYNYQDYVPRYTFGEEITLPKRSDSQFTLAVVPDTQAYVYREYQNERHKSYPMNQYEIMIRQMEFIAKNAESNGGDIPFVIILGDLVDSFHWFKFEWEKADEAISKLDNVVPLGIIIGNHDYDRQVFQKDGGYHVKGSRLFNKYFGPKSKYFKNKDWFGGASESGLSSYSIFNGGGQDFLFVGLEMEPSDDEIAWADSIIKKYYYLPVILTTHSYLRLVRDPENDNNAAFQDMHYKDEGKGNSGKGIFDKLVYNNKNILFVLSGHCYSKDSGESSRLDFNADGYPVYSIMCDYQGRKDLYKTLNLPGEAQECGDGWFRLMDFDIENKQVHCKTYSTEFHTYETDEDSDFVIKFDFDWDERFKK